MASDKMEAVDCNATDAVKVYEKVFGGRCTDCVTTVLVGRVGTMATVCFDDWEKDDLFLYKSPCFNLRGWHLATEMIAVQKASSHLMCFKSTFHQRHYFFLVAWHFALFQLVTLMFIYMRTKYHVRTANK